MDSTLLLILTSLVLFLVVVQVFEIRLPFPKKRAFSQNGDGLGLEEVIQSITDDILKSQKRISEGSGESMFFVEKAQVTISFIVKKSLAGTVRLMAVEGGGDYATEQLHQVTLDLSTTPPLMEAIIQSVISKNKDINEAVVDLEKLLSDDSENIFRKFQQRAGE